MQLNYSHLKILKSKIHFLFLVTLFCAHVTWWQHFTTLAIRVFSLPFFLNAKSPIFAVGFFEEPPELTKDPNGLLLWNNQIVKRGNFVTGTKIFTRKNLIISIVLIWYLPKVNLLYFLPVLMYSRWFFCKWFKFCCCVLYGPNVTYLTPQNKFLEDLRY